jgi:ubiquinone/menaquinone biosynthesis C-methylase UbiE
MVDDKTARVKAAIKNNFDESADIYQRFEDRYAFFQRLTDTLVSRMSPAPGSDILDVGCGTGSSSAHILQAVPGCRVWGLDNSGIMLAMARSRLGDEDRLSFVEGDGARLGDYFDFRFEAILYTASIFLIPDYPESLRQARALLKKGGSVGLTIMDGLYDPDDTNLLAAADQEAQEGVSLRRPVLIPAFTALFREIFPRQQSWIEDLHLPEEILRDFYSVPAMSAGLFPKIEYSERVRKVGRLFDHLPKTDHSFRWIFMVGEAGDE